MIAAMHDRYLMQKHFILLMAEILHHLGYIKTCKQWDKLPTNWCRISAINGSIDFACSLHVGLPTKNQDFQVIELEAPNEFDIFTMSSKQKEFDIWVFPKIGGFTPKSSILIGFSIINHPFWGTPIFGNTHILIMFHLLNFVTSIL